MPSSQKRGKCVKVVWELQASGANAHTAMVWQRRHKLLDASDMSAVTTECACTTTRNLISQGCLLVGELLGSSMMMLHAVFFGMYEHLCDETALMA